MPKRNRFCYKGRQERSDANRHSTVGNIGGFYLQVPSSGEVLKTTLIQRRKSLNKISTNILPQITK